MYLNRRISEEGVGSERGGQLASGLRLGLDFPKSYANWAVAWEKTWLIMSYEVK